MKVTVKKQSVMEGTTLVKELYFLTLSNEKGQEITLNVGAKTYTGVQTLLEQKPEEKPMKKAS